MTEENKIDTTKCKHYIKDDNCTELQEQLAQKEQEYEELKEENKPCKHSADDIEYGKNTICKLGHTTTRYGDILCVPENCEYLKMEQECEQLKQKLNNAKQEAFDEFMSMNIYSAGLINCDSRKIKEQNRALNDEIKILKEALKKTRQYLHGRK